MSVKKKQEAYPTFKKLNTQNNMTRSEWIAKKKAEMPKFTKTETMEEFLARGGSVKTGETPKYESSGNSRYTFNDKRMGFIANERKFSKQTTKENAIGMSKASFVEKQLEKRVKRKVKTNEKD
jgi:hypothetical protein